MNRINGDSFKQRNIDQLREVSAFVGYAPPAYEPKMKSRKPTQKQVDTILGLWNEVSYTKSPLALREFIFKIVKVRPLHIANLNEQEARTMITVLLKMKEHKEANGD